jgi:hypothetical protein
LFLFAVVVGAVLLVHSKMLVVSHNQWPNLSALSIRSGDVVPAHLVAASFYPKTTLTGLFVAQYVILGCANASCVQTRSVAVRQNQRLAVSEDVALVTLVHLV